MARENNMISPTSKGLVQKMFVERIEKKTKKLVEQVR
jgi:hypothetical protein